MYCNPKCLFFEMTREPKGTGMIGGMININFWYLQIKEDKVNINELNDILNKNAQEFDVPFYPEIVCL